MLGEKIGEEKGKVTTQRVLPGDDFRYVKMEISFQAQGKIYGADAMDIGTYTIYERVGGQLYGEGQGIVQTTDGEGAIWKGHGVGRATGNGMEMKFAFSLAYQAPTAGKLSRLNNVLVIGEHTIDNDNNASSTIWEWKA